MVETREQAEEAVRSDKQAGYIAIKVVDRLSKEPTSPSSRQPDENMGWVRAGSTAEAVAAAKQCTRLLSRFLNS